MINASPAQTQAINRILITSGFSHQGANGFLGLSDKEAVALGAPCHTAVVFSGTVKDARQGLAYNVRFMTDDEFFSFL